MQLLPRLFQGKLSVLTASLLFLPQAQKLQPLFLIVAAQKLLNLSRIGNGFVCPGQLFRFSENAPFRFPLHGSVSLLIQQADPVVLALLQPFFCKPLLLFLLRLLLFQLLQRKSRLFILSGCFLEIMDSLFPLSKIFFILSKALCDFRHIGQPPFLKHADRIRMSFPLQHLLLLLKLRPFLLLLFLSSGKLILKLLFLPLRGKNFPVVILCLFLPLALSFFGLLPLPSSRLQPGIHILQLIIQQAVPFRAGHPFPLPARIQPLSVFPLLLPDLLRCGKLFLQLILRLFHIRFSGKIGLRFFGQHELIITRVLRPYDPHIPKGPFQSVQAFLNLIHLFHGVHHGAQILIRQRLQGIVQNLIHLRWFEFLRKLRRAHLHQKPDELLILLQLPKAENVLIHQLLVFARTVREWIFLSEHLP